MTSACQLHPGVWQSVSIPTLAVDADWCRFVYAWRYHLSPFYTTYLPKQRCSMLFSGQRQHSLWLRKYLFIAKKKHWLECLSQVCLGNTIALISLMLQAGSRCFQELSASQTPWSTPRLTRLFVAGSGKKSLSRTRWDEPRSQTSCSWIQVSWYEMSKDVPHHSLLPTSNEFACAKQTKQGLDFLILSWFF